MTASDFPADTDVLVVGAGPTGLALATSLRQLGADVTIIDLGTEIRTDSGRPACSHGPCRTWTGSARPAR